MMHFLRFWPTITIIILLVLGYTVDGAYRTANLLQSVGFHEAERLAEKLDSFLSETQKNSTSSNVTLNKQTNRFQETAGSSAIPDKVLAEFRTDRGRQWVKLDDKLWRLVANATNKDEATVREVEISAYLKALSIPESVGIRIYDVYGKQLYALNNLETTDIKTENLAKLIRSPVRSGFQVTNKFGGYDFYSILPRSDGVLLASVDSKTFNKKILTEASVRFGCGFGAILLIIAFNFILGKLGPFWRKKTPGPKPLRTVAPSNEAETP